MANGLLSQVVLRNHGVALAIGKLSPRGSDGMASDGCCPSADVFFRSLVSLLCVLSISAKTRER